MSLNKIALKEFLAWKEDTTLRFLLDYRRHLDN